MAKIGLRDSGYHEDGYENGESVYASMHQAAMNPMIKYYYSYNPMLVYLV